MGPAVPVCLVADDEAGLRSLVRAALESPACRVIEAADGDEAWGLIQAHRPAVAILDIAMPGRDGLDLVRAVRADPALRHAFIVLLTARGTANDIDAGLRAGADRYVVKPFSPLALLDVVDDVLRRPPAP